MREPVGFYSLDISRTSSKTSENNCVYNWSALGKNTYINRINKFRETENNLRDRRSRILANERQESITRYGPEIPQRAAAKGPFDRIVYAKLDTRGVQFWWDNQPSLACHILPGRRGMDTAGKERRKKALLAEANLFFGTRPCEISQTFWMLTYETRRTPDDAPVFATKASIRWNGRRVVGCRQ